MERAAGQNMAKYVGRAERYSCGVGVDSSFPARAVSLKICTLFLHASWGLYVSPLNVWLPFECLTLYVVCTGCAHLCMLCAQVCI